TEEFPQWAWDGMRKAELFGITIGERWGGAGLGDIEAAIVLEELARADVSSAILAQLIFNGPPRAIEHLGNDAMKDRWLPIAASGAALAFDDVRIEPDDVLLWGDPGNNESFKTLISHINHERCGNAAMCVGAAQGALEYAVNYMNERKIGDQTLAQLQGLQWKIADMATQLEGARLLLQRAGHMAGPHGTPPA